VSKFKLSLTRASNSYPSLEQVKKNRIKRTQTSYTHRASCQLQLQARVSKFKLSLTRASDSYLILDASPKKNDKKIQTSHIHRASCSFKPECQNSSPCYQELQKQAPTFMQVKIKKKLKKRLKLLTLIGPAANCSFKRECQNSRSR
jgi:hypothetical protein